MPNVRFIKDFGFEYINVPTVWLYLLLLLSFTADFIHLIVKNYLYLYFLRLIFYFMKLT